MANSTQNNRHHLYSLHLPSCPNLLCISHSLWVSCHYSFLHRTHDRLLTHAKYGMLTITNMNRYIYMYFPSRRHINSKIKIAPHWGNRSMYI